MVQMLTSPPIENKPLSPAKMRTRQALIETVKRVLADHGLAAMTVEMILKEGGFARTTFYAHFADKNDVTREIVREMWERTADCYRDFSEIPELNAFSVREWLNSVRNNWNEHFRDLTVLLREVPGQVMSDSASQIETFAVALIGDGRHWNCSQEEAMRRAHLLIVQLERAMMDMYRGTWKVDPIRLFGTLSQVWIATIAAPQE